MLLCEDANNRNQKHIIKHNYWDSVGVKYLKYGLPCGDYILVNDKVQEMLNRKTARGIEPKKMDFLGTYDVVVDTKRDMLEVLGNICGKEHARFRDELILAKNNGIKLYVLVENNNLVKSLSDVFRWENPRAHNYNKIAYMHKLGKWTTVPLPKSAPTSGATLAKAMITIQAKYGCSFVFCTPQEAGQKVIDLLKGEER